MDEKELAEIIRREILDHLRVKVAATKLCDGTTVSLQVTLTYADAGRNDVDIDSSVEWF